MLSALLLSVGYSCVTLPPVTPCHVDTCCNISIRTTSFRMSPVSPHRNNCHIHASMMSHCIQKEKGFFLFNLNCRIISLESDLMFLAHLHKSKNVVQYFWSILAVFMPRKFNWVQLQITPEVAHQRRGRCWRRMQSR